MDYWMLTAWICAGLLAILCWLPEPARDHLLERLPSPFDDLLDDWLQRGLVLVLLMSLSVPMAFALSSPGVIVAADSPAESGGTATATSPSPTSSATETTAPPQPSRPSLSGRVVTRANNKLTPIAGATVTFGDSHAVTDDQGRFSVVAPPTSGRTLLLRVTHNEYVTSFVRGDDARLTGTGAIEMTPRRRIVVLAAGAKMESGDVRRALEQQLQSNDIALLADDGIRDKILQELYRYQEGRALYDQRTLQKVGSFHGATHGVFWSIDHGPGALEFEVRLVNFATTDVEQTVSVRLASEDQFRSGASYVADLLLAKLTTVGILTPQDGARTGHWLSVEGFALLRPKTWTLWLSVVPDGNTRHYPQHHITAQNDGAWYASAVYVGPEEKVVRPTGYRIYAVYANPELTNAIQRYIDGGSNSGLDLNSCGPQQCAVLGHVNVVRLDTADREPTGRAEASGPAR